MAEIDENLNDESGEITGYTLEAADIVYAGIDDTLTISGKAADAKVTGDRLAAKQDILTDIDTIRSGASLGSTALQAVPDTYRTADDQDIIDAGKQDTLLAGAGISIEDGTITSSSVVTLWENTSGDQVLWSVSTGFTLADDPANYKYLVMVSASGLVYQFPTAAQYFSFMPMSTNTGRIYFAKGAIAWSTDSSGNHVLKATYATRFYLSGPAEGAASTTLDVAVDKIYGVV